MSILHKIARKQADTARVCPQRSTGLDELHQLAKSADEAGCFQLRKRLRLREWFASLAV